MHRGSCLISAFLLETNKETETFKTMQDTENELEAKLEESKSTELELAITVPSGHVQVPTPASIQPARTAPQKNTVPEDKLEKVDHVNELSGLESAAPGLIIRKQK